MRVLRKILQVIATSCLLAACGGTNESNIEYVVPEIKTDVYRDGKGAVINPLGWQIRLYLKTERFHRSTNQQVAEKLAYSFQEWLWKGSQLLRFQA